MSSMVTKKYDFKKMYEEATIQDEASVAETFAKVKLKVRKLYDIMYKLTSQAKKALHDFKIKLTNWPDDTEKFYLEYQTEMIYCSFNNFLNSEFEIIKSRFGSIDTDLELDKKELLKKNPYKDSFDQTNLVIKECKEKYNCFISNLEELLSEQNINRIRFLKNRAETLIEKFDEYGVYQSIFEHGSAEIVFNIEREGEFCDRYTMIYITNQINRSRSLFTVLPDNISQMRMLERKYHELVIAEKNFSEYFHDLWLMINCLVENLDGSVKGNIITLKLHNVHRDNQI